MLQPLIVWCHWIPRCSGPTNTKLTNKLISMSRDKCWVQKYNLLTISIDVYIFLWHYQLDIDHPLQVSSLCFINVSTVLVCVAN